MSLVWSLTVHVTRCTSQVYWSLLSHISKTAPPLPGTPCSWTWGAHCTTACCSWVGHSGHRHSSRSSTIVAHLLGLCDARSVHQGWISTLTSVLMYCLQCWALHWVACDPCTGMLALCRDSCHTGSGRPSLKRGVYLWTQACYCPLGRCMAVPEQQCRTYHLQRQGKHSMAKPVHHDVHNLLVAYH